MAVGECGRDEGGRLKRQWCAIQLSTSSLTGCQIEHIQPKPWRPALKGPESSLPLSPPQRMQLVGELAGVELGAGVGAGSRDQCPCSSKSEPTQRKGLALM